MGDLKDHMIQSIANGDCSCSMSEARSMAAEVRRRRAADPAPLLSESEREALLEIARYACGIRDDYSDGELMALPPSVCRTAETADEFRRRYGARLLAPAGTVGPASPETKP